MPTVQEDILNAFCAKLAKLASIDDATVEALRKTLGSGKKLIDCGVLVEAAW